MDVLPPEAGKGGQAGGSGWARPVRARRSGLRSAKRRAALPPDRETRQGAASFSSLRSLATLAFYHHQVLLAGFLLPLLLAAAASVFLETSYEVESRLLVLIGRDYLGDNEGSALSANLVPDQARALQTEIEILSSGPVSAAALRAVGPQAVFPDLAGDTAADEESLLDNAVRRVTRQLRIGTIQNSNVIRIRFANADAVVAADFVNALVEAYFAQRRQVFARTQSEFLAEQRNQAEGRLRSLEARINDIRQRNRIIDVVQEQAALLARQQETMAARQAATARNAALALEIEAYGRQLARIPAEVLIQRESTEQPSAEYRRSALRSLEAERERLARSGPSGAPALASLERQIAALRAFGERDSGTASDQRRVGRNLQYDQLGLERARRVAELAGLRATLEGLDQHAAVLTARQAQLEALDLELSRLNRQRRIEEQNFLDYTRRTEETRVQEDAARHREANVRLFQAAQPPREGRRLTLNVIAAGFAAGLLMAPMATLVAARLRKSFLLPEEAERELARPVLASFWNFGRRRAKRSEPEVMAEPLEHENVKAVASFAHKIARHGFATGMTGGVLLLSGSAEGSGAVATTARMLALSVARMSEKPVLLLDRGGRSGPQFEHFRRRGLLSELDAQHLLAAERRAAGEPLPLPGFAQVEGMPLFLAEQPGVEELAFRLGRDGQLVDALRRRFGLTIIDGVGFDADTRSLDLAADADAAVLVLVAEVTNRFSSREMVRKLEDTGCPVIGTVLAERKAYIPKALYGLI